MLRWGLLFFGLFLLIGGIGALNDYQPAEEDADPITVDQARDLVIDDARQFITLQAEVDQAKLLYPTGLASPKYCRTPPQKLLAVDPNGSAADLVKLAGCAVEVESIINPLSVLKVQVITYNQNGSIEDGTVNSERFIAPLLNYDNRLFVCSAALTPDSPRGDDFKTQTNFTGRLCYLKDLTQNVPSLQTETRGIASFFLQEYGVSLPHNAMVILTDADIKTPASTYYAPIAGAGYALFVEFDVEDPPPAGTITGELASHNVSSYRELGRTLGAQLPDRIGIVSVQTAEQYNASKKVAASVGIKYGIYSMIAGVALIARRRWKKRRLLNRAVGQSLTSAAMGDSWRHAA